MLQTTTRTDATPANNKVTDNPRFRSPYEVSVNVLAFRGNPAFRQSIIVAQILPPTLLGDYHLADTTSPARGAGLANLVVSWGSGLSYTVGAASPDIDGDARPTGTGANQRYDAGSDQMTP